MKKKVIVLNFEHEFMSKKAFGEEIIYYFFDFIYNNNIDEISFPKSSEEFFKHLTIKNEFNITFHEDDLSKEVFFNNLKDDIRDYHGIMLINNAYPTLDYIFNFYEKLKNFCEDGINYAISDKSESNFSDIDNNISYKIAALNCNCCEEILNISYENYREKIKKINNFNSIFLDIFNIKKLSINNIFDLNSNFNYISTLNEIKFIINKKHIDNGVIIMDPNNTFIDYNVKIGYGTIVYPGCILEKNTEIGKNCTIFPSSKIINSNIGDNALIQYSTIIESKIEDDTVIGPYAYIRPETVLGKHSKVGAFVEVKKSNIGNNTKIPHLSYVGDAVIGESCNIGCGSIFANYDGNNKHKTIVGNNVFIGSNSNLVAPVLIHDNAFTAAGSTITNEVPENSLAIARARQVNIKDWVIKNKNK